MEGNCGSGDAQSLGNAEDDANVCDTGNSHTLEENSLNDVNSEICDESHPDGKLSANENQMTPSESNSTSDYFDREFIDVSDEILATDITSELLILKQQNKSMYTQIQKLEKENARLEADRSAELHVIQLEGLEKTILQQKKDIQQLQESLKQQEDVSHIHMNLIKQEYESELEKVNKKCSIANKERESMVMKYAISEKSVIDLRKEIQSLENKVKDLVKEKEVTLTKLKTMASEKTKICQQLDSKVNDIAKMERENQKRKDEIQMRDSKIKWAQNRLKSEVDSHADTQSKLDKMQQKFNEFREETEQFKKHTQMIIKNYQEAQEDKNNQEQEERAKLIIDRHDEETLARVQQELENYKKKHKDLMEENSGLCHKIQNMEKERVECDSNLSKMKQTIDLERRNNIDLAAQLNDLESVRTQLTQEQERLTTCQSEMGKLRTLNTDLQQEMESCREREGELLEFTQKLTEKNVVLQSELSAVSARAHQLHAEHDSCKTNMENLESNVASLTRQVESEKNQRAEERELLTKRITEQNDRINRLSQELTDQQGENQLLKKKHLVSLKELTKELTACRKRLETYENSNCNISLGEGSRTSSTASLNMAESNENKSNCNQVPSVDSISVELDPQILINKIIKIQKSSIRKSEKLEFLQEHVKQLVAELQKKTRIIQSYIIREQAGSLSSETMDNYKAALSKHGGIMASLYNSKAVDEGMTLEFSLEINKKLQAVLEDTLLKNITLKENIETLGNEIARLTTCEMSGEKS